VISSRLKLDIPLFSRSRLCNWRPIHSISCSITLYSRCFLCRLSSADRGSIAVAVAVAVCFVLCDIIDFGNGFVLMRISDEK